MALDLPTLPDGELAELRRLAVEDKRAMLAKTKVSTEMTAGGGTNNTSAYQPKKHFQAPKAKQASSKNERPTNKRQSHLRQPTSDGASREKKEVIVNSQKSIYKPTLKRVDSSNLNA